MTYLWINPVSERMISVEALERMLEKHDLTRVVCRESWGEIVLRKYRADAACGDRQRAGHPAGCHDP